MILNFFSGVKGDFSDSYEILIIAKKKQLTADKSGNSTGLARIRADKNKLQKHGAKRP